jgi:hypothetical protein
MDNPALLLRGNPVFSMIPSSLCEIAFPVKPQYN